MNHPKLMQLIQKIHYATAQGSIQWQETEGTDLYQCSFSNYSVRVGQRSSRYSNGEIEYYISVLDEFGDVIEDIGDEDGESQAERSSLLKLLRELFDSARRRAKGVDEALDSILSDIDDLLT